VAIWCCASRIAFFHCTKPGEMPTTTTRAARFTDSNGM